MRAHLCFFVVAWIGCSGSGLPPTSSSPVPVSSNPPSLPAPAGSTALDLVGHPVSGVPHFTRVRSFHQGETVHVGVDPVRGPELATDCVIYVVADRTAAEWDADPMLVEVRGSSQPASFGAPDLAANLVALVGSEQLPGHGSAGTGVGYDLVLDCDGDGALSPGDAIDGAEGAGFYVLPDLAALGPHAVTQVSHDSGAWLEQITYLPSDLASMGQVPLVMVAHGFGHELSYYDHLGQHLASYGYVVSSFRNDVGEGDDLGTETAATTLLENTEHILANAATLAEGVLDGHLDRSRIVWIGHSTGGECVVRAYTRLHDGAFTSAEYDAESIALVSSMAPVAWLDGTQSNPYDVNFHLITGAADRDTGNYPEPGYTQNMALFERAVGNRHLTYLHGAGHGDLHAGSQNWLDMPDPLGPNLIGQAGAHPVVLSYHLALIEWYTRGNEGMRDYFERNSNDFRPMGIAEGVTVTTEFRPAQDAGHWVVDDFQGEPDLGVSTSGAQVSGDVVDRVEIRMFDQDWSYAWTGDQPANGMTRNAYPGDTSRATLFEWGPGDERFLEFSLVPEQQDLTGASHLAFRVAQGTRHPFTEALAGGLSFGVRLVDADGPGAVIDFGVYGEVNPPYRRSGSGDGAGWANEFASVRVPLEDLGASVDLSDVRAVRFEFGGGSGSAQGRVALDDLMFIRR